MSEGGASEFASVDWRAPQDAATRLAAWFAGKLSVSRVEVRRFERPTATGMSSLTYMLDLEWEEAARARAERLVVRQEPMSDPTFYQADMAAWARAQGIVAEVAGYAPKVLFIETDPAVLGSAFFAMRRIEGDIASDRPPYRLTGWVLEATPAERRLMWLSALEMLADIHRVDWRAAGLGFIRRGAGALELGGQIDYFAVYCDWACGRRTPLVERTVRWLRANAPEPEQLCLTWGDARPANMVFQGGRCVGALDWELVSIGDPAQDLAWWAFSEHMFDRLLGGTVPEGCLAGDDLVRAYEAMTGQPLANYRYYQVYSALRALAISERVASVNRSHGRDMGLAGDFVTDALAAMLDAAAIHGEGRDGL